ncbi:MAG: dihydropteroate synthase [Pseudomonadales bacterium]
MGVLNVTPDSFSDGGRLFSAQRPDLGAIEELARGMLDDGAVILDVGGESTRPGAEPVSADEECERVMPVIERLLGLDTILCVDTRKSEVAIAAIAMGCHMINDVTGLRGEGMLSAVADGGTAVCIMHMLGEPRSMQRDPHYVDVVGEVRDFLAERVNACAEAGIDSTRLLIVPGIGFGKTLDHNLALLRNLTELKLVGPALLVGVSRKSMLGTITGRSVRDRVVGSAVAAALAVQHGANIVRVHDVAATADALAMVQAWTAPENEL